ncbi:hypothetical protein [Bacillus subtilis]|nr:hypothetical protein [Bacillus subtilis]CCU57694.1 hypothetical protein BSUBE1_1063 [Bacillus subtilis E1]
MEMVEIILRDLAWLVAILTGITTMFKNIKEMKDNKKRRSPAKKKRRK